MAQGLNDPPPPVVRVPTNLRDLLAGTYSIIAIGVVIAGIISWALRNEGRLNELTHQNESQERRMSDFDMRGTRALSERTALLGEQIDNLDKREGENTRVLNNRIDMVIRRLIEHEDALRQERVIETRQEEMLRRLDRLEAEDRRHSDYPRGPTGPR